MIKQNELRYGNMVNYGGSLNIVLGIMSPYPSNDRFNGKVVVEINPPDSFNVTLDELSPIVLTPEILKKCEFEIYPWGWVKKSSHDFGIRLNLQTFYYAVSGNNPVRLKYLHQLQNLYYVLTGEELIYTT